VGPGGTLLDYVPFHLGPRNLFLFNLHTGRVPGYSEGQRPLLTLVVSVEEVAAAGLGFVVYDGHALSAFSRSFHTLDGLRHLDWEAIDGSQFGNDDRDLKRRKQAEFIVHDAVPWNLVKGIAVCDTIARRKTLDVLERFPPRLHKRVAVAPQFYF
jgi:hypothetical protein